MTASWLAIPTLFALQLGFAGVLGAQLYRLRSKPNNHLVAAVLLMAGLAVLTPLSMPTPLPFVGWAAASAVMLLFTFRPIERLEPLWSLPFTWRYGSLVMLLVASWGILRGSSWFWFVISGLALLASILAWGKSNQ